MGRHSLSRSAARDLLEHCPSDIKFNLNQGVPDGALESGSGDIGSPLVLSIIFPLESAPCVP
jgi:hypothetical protein